VGGWGDWRERESVFVCKRDSQERMGTHIKHYKINDVNVIRGLCESLCLLLSRGTHFQEALIS
jgi:hypothetical protein